MDATGKGGGDCLRNASNGFLFVFDGETPGWHEPGVQPSVQTEILIFRYGSPVVGVMYNGSQR